ncbi:MAG: rRNA maturation RNase YbeY [Oscillospiraceae bacterium]|nr:rRNA maturation RNase YbeY [Oscillospiraceae bacterium]MBQ4545191.1 rRNA maturation RNase YbeY [Oscillospiraceae bacterium]MBQ6902578.1 rRNA maturation RNase YbeY [Oscillospiraceae bacterium]
MAEHSITVVCKENSEALEALITKTVKAALDAENVEQSCDVCVIITDDENIHELNMEHRGVDRPTDVLSFPMLELSPGQKIEVNPLEIDASTGAVMLGDIVISEDRARAQAEEYGHSEEREFAFLTVHGMLHLLGYDHEKGEEDEKLHFSRQEEILTAMGIGR